MYLLVHVGDILNMYKDGLKDCSHKFITWVKMGFQWIQDREETVGPFPPGPL